MMNVAAPQSASLPNHFAPPARTPSTRRQLYHHPTLHMRTGSNSSPRHSAQEFVPFQRSSSPLPPQYSPPAAQQQFKRPLSNQPSPPLPPIPGSYPTHVHSQTQQKQPLQRQTTTGSSNSLNQYIHPGPPLVAGHRRQTASTSTSASSIARIPSYPSSTPPMMQARPNSMSPADTYVARLRRAKATVWSARGQREDLDRSNSKEDKYNKKYVQAKQRTSSSKNKLTAGGPMYGYEIGLPAHPRQLMPRLSANEAEDSDYMDPFMSGPNFFDTTGTAAASTKGSVKTKTTTSSTSPSASAQNVPLMLTPSNDTSTRDNETKSSASIEDGRGSPDPMQSYYKPIVRGQSKRVARGGGDDDVKDRQVGGERRLFVVNASSESEEED